MSDAKIPLIMVGVTIAAVLLGFAGCNRLWNNKRINTPAYQIVSYGTGLTGHVEYTKYTDGSRDVKIYHGLGHRVLDSELHQDTDGDGYINRIRRNGAEWKFNSIREILVEELHYDTHKKDFDKANARLQELMDKYD